MDAAAGGALMYRSVDEAYDLFENMVLNHYQWSTDREALKQNYREI